MTVTPLPENVLSVYLDATPAHVRAGTHWYDEAHDLALSLDPDNPVRAAGVIAALSPRQSWPGNKTLATLSLTTGVARGMLRDKVQTILDSPDITKDEVISVLNGQKITRFFLNIMGDPDVVTIDMHAHDIAVGRVTDDKTRRILGRKGGYESFVDAYRTAAEIAGIWPSRMQAITWVTWKANL